MVMFAVVNGGSCGVLVGGVKDTRILDKTVWTNCGIALI